MTEDKIKAEDIEIWNLATTDRVTVYCLGIENFNKTDYERLKQQILKNQEIVERLEAQINQLKHQDSNDKYYVYEIESVLQSILESKT